MLDAAAAAVLARKLQGDPKILHYTRCCLHIYLLAPNYRLAMVRNMGQSSGDFLFSNIHFFDKSEYSTFYDIGNPYRKEL